MSEFPISVFYHCYIPQDALSLYWNWWIDDQIGKAEKSGLTKVAKFNMCITMPTMWSSAGNYEFHLGFEHKVREYINKRYPFVNIIEVRDTGLPNLYEGSTLYHLHQYCLDHPNEYVVYYHTKGVLSIGVETKLWRELLDEIIINQWQMRYYDIQDYDVVGVGDSSPHDILSGNYFWAKSNYVATLPNPLDIFEDRFSFERWLFINNPSKKIVFDLKGKDQYNEMIIYNKINM